MGLAKSYCREIAKELDKIAIFLPGDPVEVGDIITFGKGLIKPGPVGSFDHVSSLKELGVNYELDNGGSPQTYLYASKGSVGVTFTADANAATVGKGKLDIAFGKEGSTYFAAVDCMVSKIADTSNLKEQLIPLKDRIDWGNAYIVTGITIAGKALIMQSNTKSANLVIEGDVKGLAPSTGVEINASAGVKINSYKDSSFIKPWTDNVTVFFSLARFGKKFLGDYEFSTKAMIDDDDAVNFEECSASAWIKSVEENT